MSKKSKRRIALGQGLGLYKKKEDAQKPSKNNSKREKGTKIKYKRILGNQIL